MKQADLVVGSEYAVKTFDPYDGPPAAARVQVVSIDGGGRATVKVLEPGPKSPHSWQANANLKRGHKTQVSTRDIVCPWAEWADRAATALAEKEALRAEQAARREQWEEEHADRTRVDPNRPVPAQYEEEWRSWEDPEEREALVPAYIAAAGLGPLATHAEIAPLLADLPLLVARDVMGAASVRHTPAAPKTVGAVLERSARLLELARIAGMGRGTHAGSVPPETQLGDADLAFMAALTEHFAEAGDELRLPPVPALPSWVDDESRAFAATFGWMRVAVARTSGNNIHDPGCRTTSDALFYNADHLPWWHVLLEPTDRICGVCDGPGLRDLIAFAGFAAAVDVWASRGRDALEGWQITAAMRLVAETAVSRARIGEPDVTLFGRVVDALAADEPGEEGWHAHWLMEVNDWNRSPGELAKLNPVQVEAARTVARDRLTTVADQLPTSQRPLPLPASADVDVLRERYRMLRKSLAGLPSFSRLLFGLPGAR